MAGRPSKYRSEYAEQAYKLCLLGVNDEGLAFFFGVTLEDIAIWAWDQKEFFDAITPSAQCIREYQERCDKDREKRNQKKRAWRAASPSERIRSATASRIWAALKGRSDGKLFSRLGYSVDELMQHLEARFGPRMSWDNYGAWHIDHIRPCASFDLTDSAQFSQCWDLSNLQPLWAGDNIRKGASYAGAEG
jgi:hypothetical protein